jgi:predicted transcriptional regulator
MAYQPTQRQKNNAKKLGVTIRSSSNPSKKLDVLKNGVKIASIGAKGYNDYDLWIKKKGLEYANQRRKLYKIRHENNRNKKGTAGFYADKILW